MKYYLAHPFVNRKWIRTWEQGVEEEYGVELLNPFYDVERKDITEADINGVATYEGNPNLIVGNDTALLQSCRGFIAIITGAISYGTIMEIIYAYFCPEVEHIILLVTNGAELHPWFRYHATHIVTTFTALEELIRKL